MTRSLPAILAALLVLPVPPAVAAATPVHRDEAVPSEATLSPVESRRRAAVEAGMPEELAELVAAAVTRLLALEEPIADGPWPYEGVYRVRGQIPIGYRVGGSAIVASALLQAPGYGGDAERRAAVARAAEFVAAAIEDPRMSPQYSGGYDVRGWGYIYGLRFLLAFESAGAPPELAERVGAAIEFYLASLQAIEIPRVGGWNYARRGRLDEPSSVAPFMTSPALRALLEAERSGRRVDGEAIRRGLDALVACRGGDGTFIYMGSGREPIDPGSRPGAIGRMVSAEPLLLAAGRSSPARVREAVEAFLAYWDELESRRARTGTHLPPYGVAPYYFMFAHGAAAEAIESLPEAWRGGLRRALLDRLRSVRAEDGSWNDRVFPRSANYGTALALEAMLAPWAPPIPSPRPAEAVEVPSPSPPRDLGLERDP